MADKLDWMNKHLVLIRHTTVAEAAEKENYQMRPDLAEYFEGAANAEGVIYRLAGAGKYKEACELLAYIAHHRAAVWWGYRCAVNLQRELEQKPGEERDISEIAKSFEVTVPDFAKVELPGSADLSAVKEMYAANKAKARELLERSKPGIYGMVEAAVQAAFDEFKKVHGMDPIEMVRGLANLAAGNTEPVDPASPVFTAREELHGKLQALQKETVDTIKSVLPPKVPAHEKKKRDSALSAVYRWVAAPDDPNSKVCLDAGNECPDTPAGLLALTAFWSFGNLMPGGEQVVATPPGLAANGLCQTLLLAALHKGGVRKAKERYEEYFRLGVGVITGKDTWEESLARGKAPHEAGSGLAPAREEKAKPAPNGETGLGGYKRWNPPE
jgi:hypothetical protein